MVYTLLCIYKETGILVWSVKKEAAYKSMLLHDLKLTQIR